MKARFPNDSAPTGITTDAAAGVGVGDGVGEGEVGDHEELPTQAIANVKAGTTARRNDTIRSSEHEAMKGAFRILRVAPRQLLVQERHTFT